MRGLTVVDDAGRERILLGAPVPDSRDRKRKDGRTAVLVFLADDGADRLIVGDVPNPVLEGRQAARIGAACGVVLHDERGNERGGISYLGNGRARPRPTGPGRDRPARGRREPVRGAPDQFPGQQQRAADSGLVVGTDAKGAELSVIDAAGKPRVRLDLGPDKTQWLFDRP